MSLLNALTDWFRPHAMVQTADAASAMIEPPYAIPADELEPSVQEKQLMLHLSNASHAVNHFQNQMLTMLYPYIMAELGMSYMKVGVLSAVR